MSREFINRVIAGEVPGMTADANNPALAYDPPELDAPKGTKVRFTGYGGYDHDKKEAAALLVVDAIYTIEDWRIGDWSSSISLAEVPGKRFNHVMFAGVTP